MRNNVASDSFKEAEVGFLRQRVLELEEQLDRQTAEHGFFRALVEHAPESIVFASADHTITYANPAFCTMLGFDNVSHSIGINIASLYAEPAERITQIYEDSIANGSWQGVLMYRRSDGTTFLGQASIFALSDNQDTLPGTGGIIRHISAQAQDLEGAVHGQPPLLEKSTLEEHLHTFSEFQSTAATLPTFVFKVCRQSDGALVYTFCEGHLAQEFESTTDSIRGKTPVQAFGWYLGRKLETYYEHIFRCGQPVTYDVQVENRWFLVNLAPVYKDGKDRFASEIVGAGFEITERKQMEEALRESENRYRTLSRNFPNGVVFLFDCDLRYQVAGGEKLAVVGMSPKTLEGKTIHEVLPPDLYAIAEPFYRSILAGTAPAELEQHYGEQIYRTQPVTLRNEQGEIIGGMIISQDITAQKHMEEEVRTNQRFIQQIADTAPYMLYVFDLACGYNIFINRSTMEFFGHSLEEMQQLGLAFFATVLHPDDHSRLAEFSTQWSEAQDGQVFVKEYRLRNAAGEWRWIRSHEVVFARGQDSFPRQILGTALDITEQKHAEEERLRTAEEFKITIQNLHNYVFKVCRRADGQPIYTFCEGRLAEELGTTTEYVNGKTPIEVFGAQMGQEIQLCYEHVFRTGQPRIHETRVGNRWFVTSLAPVFVDDHGMEIIGSGIEITSRKQAEQALQEREALLRGIFDHAPLTLYIKDTQGRYLQMSQQGATLLRIGQEEMIGQTDDAIFPPDVLDAWHTTDRHVLTTAQVLEFDTVVPLADGIHHFISTKFPIYNAHGSICAIGGSATDITARKRAEDALRESQALLQNIIDYAPASIFVKDLEGRLLLANQRFCEVFHLDQEQVLGQKDADLFHPSDVAMWHMQDYQVITTGLPGTFEETGHLDDGTHTYLSIKFPLYNAQRKMYAVGGIVTEITERKTMEQALRERETLFRLTFDQSPIGAAMVSMDYRFLRVNATLCRITGYEPHELMALGFPDITHPDDLAADLEQARQLAADEIDQYTMDKRYIRKDGQIVWVHLTGRLVKDGDDQPLYFLSLVEDITERKRAEEALHESRTLLQSIIDYAPAVIYMKDTQWRVLLVN